MSLSSREVTFEGDLPSGYSGPWDLGVTSVRFDNESTMDHGMPTRDAADGAVYFIYCAGHNLKIRDLIKTIGKSALNVQSCQ